MPGLYIVIASMLALLIAMETGRRWLRRLDLLHWLNGTLLWVVLAWLVALTTALTVGDVFEGAVFMVLVGFAQMIVMAVSSWLIMRFRFRNRPALRSWVLGGISYLAGCFTLWNASWFFGMPYSVMKIALRGHAPLVFTIREYQSESWTDFTARIVVEFPPGVLKEAVAGMKRYVSERGEHIFSWDNHPGGAFGQICTISTDGAMTVATIVYMAD